jgi:DNA-binding NarL/FixJ family response regulator
MQLEATRPVDEWLDELTRREQEILRLMAEGRSNAGISEALVLSLRTVESHVRTIFLKLRLTQGDRDNRRVLAVLTYLGLD